MHTYITLFPKSYFSINLLTGEYFENILKIVSLTEISSSVFALYWDIITLITDRYIDF